VPLKGQVREETNTGKREGEITERVMTLKSVLVGM
jgi:hypothetical protein